MKFRVVIKDLIPGPGPEDFYEDLEVVEVSEPGEKVLGLHQDTDSLYLNHTQVSQLVVELNRWLGGQD